MLIKTALNSLCYKQYTAFYLPPINNSSFHTQEGNDVTFDSLSHSSCEKIHRYLDFKEIVS